MDTRTKKQTLLIPVFRFALLLATCLPPAAGGQGVNRQGIEGKVIACNDNQPLAGVAIRIEGTSTGVITGSDGRYSLPKLAPGRYALSISFTGMKTETRTVSLAAGETRNVDVCLQEDALTLNEVLITGKSATRKINELAYNIVAVEMKPLHNTSMDLSHALDRVSGVRIRESGGVGSGFNFSLNGFTGRQVKFFIDGIPMENFGSSFQINNIPINLAERIEVYKGVVPISFGADALGGAVNIVTGNRQNSYLDASYSFGSFNTHKSCINAGYTVANGFTLQLNLFRNYSDNNYYVDVDVADLSTGLYENRRVRRFHDNYHNETLIAQVGVTGKKYADKLLLGLTLGQNKADIQTAARMDRVFGERYRQGNILMPSIRYSKKDLFAKGLDVNITGNYNLGFEQTVDTVARQYNWLGEYKEKPSPGSELSRTLYKYNNHNGLLTANIAYKINDRHSVMLNNVFNAFDRTGNDDANPDNQEVRLPRKTIKNVAGLGYKFDYNDRWNTSVFVKHFTQSTSSFTTVYYTSEGTIYPELKNRFDKIGYGLASAYFLRSDLQLKFSYEKSFRLPENEELFGDANTLLGNTELRPESSDNLNLGLNFNTTAGRNHGLIFDGNLIVRNAVDYIRPQQNTNGTHQIMTNQRDVLNVGYNGEVRYSYKRLLTAGFNFTYQNLRNNTRYEEGATRESTVYRDRIPNMPYFFGNGDANLFFPGVGGKDNNLSIGYNLLFVYEYYLKWPSQGASGSKYTIPTQLSQDVNITYAIQKGRYNISAECRNIMDANLYDNFSLQKPGRSFSIKFRYFISNK
ncbi:MAG: carboxypeptidase-like regulatory domain-containing protein [Tannerellaceae bacterium]|jgi:outer membrane cobalamin receptor|nr:carboxypeptidase-like regulatory domain-containing protein [Tannerellaceae bacterium]